jgi:hypothetical protein
MMASRDAFPRQRRTSMNLTNGAQRLLLAADLVMVLL